MTTRLTLGVEEEFHVVDPRTRSLANDADAVLAATAALGENRFEAEIKQTMIETATAVCTSIDEVRLNLTLLRRELARAAATADRCVVAAGTAPMGHWRDSQLTPDDRYGAIVDLHQQVVWEQIVCGSHVHVGFADRELALQVLNRVRPWLSPLLALSASSPYWLNYDTGYASYRTTVWWRWPTAHVPASFRTTHDYDSLVQSLIDSGTVVDGGQIYWDVRLSANHPTLEFRVADTCSTVDEAVLHAALCRALATTACAEAQRDEPLPRVRGELLRAAKWRAARFGVSDLLLDPIEATSVPAATAVQRLLDHVRAVLEDLAEWDEVVELAQRVLTDGTSADRQRRRMREAGGLEAVVDGLILETTPPA